MMVINWNIGIFENWQSSLFHQKTFLTKFEQKGSKLAPNFNFFLFFEKFNIANIAVDISSPITYLERFWFSTFGPKY